MNRLLALLRANKSKPLQSRIDASSNEIYIYDAIVSTDDDAEWAGGVSAQSLVPQIRQLKGDITLRINSPGGDVFAAQSIAQALRDSDGTVTAYIDGVAASAATVIANAATEVKMAQGAMYMVHRAWSIALGNMNDMLALAAVLEKADSSLAKQYAQKTGASEEEMLAMMDAETWMTADEAVAAKFADSINVSVKAKSDFDLSALFKNAPKLEPASASDDHRARQQQRLRILETV